MKQVKFSLPLRMLTLICVLFISASAFAQQIAVKGHVKDESYLRLFKELKERKEKW